MTDDELIAAAKEVRTQAHAPYSRFFVGAALIDEHGRLHAGCNVENASYPEGICAEANAIGSMVAGGGRRIARIAVVGGPAGEQAQSACTPCGGCRQRILEFADDETRILLPDDRSGLCSYGIDELLPHSFDL